MPAVQLSKKGGSMSKGTSEKVSLELAFLEALDSIHADVDTSEIAEVLDWSRAVRGKFYGASVTETLLPPDPIVVLRRWHARDMRDSSTENVSEALPMPSAKTASHGSVQYSQMAIPQLIATCTSESSEGAWSEFILRFQPFIARTIARVVHRFGKVSHELVDDLTQDTFVKLCHTDFRAVKSAVTIHENSFRSFLKVVATHTVQDYFRKSLSQRGSGNTELDHVFSAPASSRDASPKPERKVLLEKIDAILKTHAHEPNFERDYTIFWLYFRDGLTAKEIADSRGVELSVKGVESTLLRLTRQMRVALKLEDARPS
jgi:RNA polymerase sigma-70 factor, ECF subfamily